MDRFLDEAVQLGLLPWVAELRPVIDKKRKYIHSLDDKAKRFLELLSRLPSLSASGLTLDCAAVTIGDETDIGPQDKAKLLEVLQGLTPWRKGPFKLFGIDIDSEWVSSRKWDRLGGRISSLEGRRVLDIGCSSGYYMFRMTAAKPAMILGLEPYMTYYFQFLLLQHYIRANNIYVLPAKFEEIPPLTGYFDTVFSMGVLYHQRSPLESLQTMGRVLRPGGELVLETLVLAGEQDFALCPHGRYAKMNNVYFIPTVGVLQAWLVKSGFHHVECLDVSTTTPDEQRNTSWVKTESLKDFLDKDHPELTVEGYPAPVRAMLVAKKRG